MDQFMNAVPYLLVGLGVVAVGLILYKYDRVTFDKVALQSFLSVEQEMGSEAGQEKMAQAVLKIIDTLPSFLKTTLTIVASLMKTDLHGLTHKMAQWAYEAFKTLHPA